MNILHFLFCNFFILLFYFFLLLIRKITREQISAKARYHLWYLFILALILPFIPRSFFRNNPLFPRISDLLSTQTPAHNLSLSPHIQDPSLSILGLSDFTPDLDRSLPHSWNLALEILWGVGFLITVTFVVFGLSQLYRIRRSAFLVTADNEPELFRQYSRCLRDLNLHRRISLYTSCQISSPVSYGILFPRILIPQDLDIQVSEKDIRFIFLHELIHYRHKDSLINGIACILQAVYWFNPAVRHGLRLLQADREIACDHSVITRTGQEEALSYADMLLRYAKQAQKQVFFSPFSSLGSRHTELYQRVHSILNYRADTWQKKAKSLGILTFLLAFLLFITPLTDVYASFDDTFSFSGERVKEIDLSAYFPKKNGTFVLYDMNQDTFQIYNQELGTRRSSPDSTFKIFSGLFALQEELITPSSTGQSWNQEPYPFESWNQDQTLASATKNSVNWYFQNLDTQMGYSRLSAYYRQISYGNCDLTGGIPYYWAESSLKISPVEQTLLLADLWQNRWNFEEENIQAVKDALYLSDTAVGRLYGKTGTGQKNGRNIRGWFVGFLEKDEQEYCFALQIQDSPNASGTTASAVTLKILTELFSVNV